MRIRSTALGETEIVGDIESVHKIGEYLIFDVAVTEPMPWHVRAGFTLGDLLRIIPQMLKPGNLAYLIVAPFKYRNPQSPVEEWQPPEEE